MVEVKHAREKFPGVRRKRKRERRKKSSIHPKKKRKAAVQAIYLVHQVPVNVDQRCIGAITITANHVVLPDLEIQKDRIVSHFSTRQKCEIKI